MYEWKTGYLARAMEARKVGGFPKEEQSRACLGTAFSTLPSLVRSSLRLQHLHQSDILIVQQEGYELLDTQRRGRRSASLDVQDSPCMIIHCRVDTPQALQFIPSPQHISNVHSCLHCNIPYMETFVASIPSNKDLVHLTRLIAHRFRQAM